MSINDLESLSVYIPMDRRQAMQDGVILDGDITGTALFADISGFTPLSEALVRSLGPQRGAEELTIHLNRFYDALIDQLHKYRGSVIGFSGDAITCWFDQDWGHRAAACALAMQRTTAQFQNIKLPDGETTTLAIKAALAFGHAKRLLVGDPDTHIKDVIIGQLMDNLAAAEKAAGSGEIILDQSVIENIQSSITFSDKKVSNNNGRIYGILGGFHHETVSPAWPGINPESLAIESLKPWLLKPVYTRLQRGQGEFLAELRPTVALFARFSGIDYEEDHLAGNKLDEFVRRVQLILLQYDGSLIQLTTGDKGSYLYAAFGAPNAHEDDSIRAVSAAAEIRDIQNELEYISSIQIGISQGTMRSGAYGGTERRTYGVLGDETNLAARLMTAAGDGQILVSKRVKDASGNHFLFDPQTPVKVKGKSSYIDLFSLKDQQTAQKNLIQTHIQDSPLFGRTDELVLAEDKIELALGSRGQIIGIEGEAGIGKSRLAAEIIRQAEERGMHGFASQCQSYGTNISYLAWRDIWASFFDIDPNLSRKSTIKRIERQLEDFSAGLSARLPLLSPPLNIRIPDNPLTENFDAKVRKSSLESLLVDCLRGGVKTAPLYILLEDCHWLDPLSHDLLEVIGRAIFDLPVLLILDFRPSSVAKGDQIRVSELPHFTKFCLSQFSPQESRQFIQFKLEEYIGSGRQVPASVVENITRRSEGNPFYIEELINYLKDSGANPNDERSLLNMELPTSLHSLVLTRIDERTEHQKTTIKVASVIGRTFAAEWVWSAFSQLNDEGQVRSDLDELSRLDLTPLDTPEPDLTYMFKHAITHEAAYKSLPFASRSDLHGQLGAFIESCCLDEIDQNIDLLAYHFEKSSNENKKRHYLLKAGEIAQTNYANQSAINYYKRALDLLTPEDKIEVMLNLCDVYILTGDWRTADQQIDQVLALAKEFNDRSALAWGQTKKADLLGKQGQYFEASIWIKRALAAFDDIGDQEGAGQIRHNAGTQAAQQGDFKKAKELYQQSLAIRTELGDDKNIANLLNNLGVVARSEGDQQLAYELGKNALHIRRAIGDKWAIAISLNNMGNIALDQGDYESARSQLEEAVALQKEIGDRFYIANGLNNLGNVAREEGDTTQAWDFYRESMEINRDLGAQWSIAYLLEDMGCLAAQSRIPETTLRLIGAASALRKSINARLSEVEQVKVDRIVSSARNSINKSQASSAWSQGTSMALDQAVEYALSINPNDMGQK